ncbi:MAG TPA: riboflavin kinase, partial [Spirochaetota bacterium]|nr:riboflavin kinase [Spirochaetota bacterium]
TERTIEVNIFDFNSDIYGMQVEVYFYDRIRDDKRFESVTALKEQLHNDMIAAQTMLKKRT